jgi:hypothetical protein
VRNILDRTDETNAGRAAAQVALFAVLSCGELRDSVPIPDLVLGPGGILGRDEVVRSLAALSKPVWIDGTVRAGRISLQVGPLSDRPDLQHRYEVWHRNRKESRSPYPPPTDEALVLCHTEAHALRIRWRDFVKYQRDYILSGPFSYGISDVEGKSPSLKTFEPAELQGITRTISIGRPGPILILDEGQL